MLISFLLFISISLNPPPFDNKVQTLNQTINTTYNAAKEIYQTLKEIDNSLNILEKNLHKIKKGIIPVPYCPRIRYQC